jgi:hypothetical protein
LFVNVVSNLILVSDNIFVTNTVPVILGCCTLSPTSISTELDTVNTLDPAVEDPVAYIIDSEPPTRINSGI